MEEYNSENKFHEGVIRMAWLASLSFGTAQISHIRDTLQLNDIVISTPEIEKWIIEKGFTNEKNKS